MKFDTTNPNISTLDALKCKKKFLSLQVDLGVRDDNYYCGSELGGNNFQLLTLQNMKHALCISGTTILVSRPDKIYWDYSFLKDSSLYNIRKELDGNFPEILETNKLIAVAFQLLLNSPKGFLRHFEENEKYFPKISEMISKGYNNYTPLSLSPSEELILACIVCSTLSDDLDSGRMENIQLAGHFLQKCSPANILLSVRKYIQINRVVKFDLIEDPVFRKALRLIRRALP